jgi:hypothetical protein
MKPFVPAFALLALAATAGAASAQIPGYTTYPPRAVDATGSVGRAPWQPSWQYDSGSDNDKRPDLPYYQQGGGQQTGGPARNLLPTDNLHFVPR